MLVGEEGARHVQANFEAKWRADGDLHACFVNHVKRILGPQSHVDFDYDEISSVFGRMRHRKRIDAEGLCMALLDLIFQNRPIDFMDMLGRFAGSCARFSSSEIVYGVCVGKEGHRPAPADTRCLLPLNCLISLLDKLVANRIHKFVERTYEIPPHVLVGTKRGTQFLDSAFISQLVVEKGLENKSQGSIASIDIEKFFDNIPILHVIQVLESKGLDRKIGVALKPDDRSHLS